MPVLTILKTPGHQGLNQTWQKMNIQSALKQKTQLFLTMAMLDAPRLNAWLKQTPDAWWFPSETATLIEKKTLEHYQEFGGALLNQIYMGAPDTFRDLLHTHPKIFNTTACRDYLTKWCSQLPASDWQIALRPCLAQLPSSWYCTKPERIHFLKPPFDQESQHLMMLVALAKNGVIHEYLETTYPGVQGFVAMLNTMSDNTKEKRHLFQKWISNTSVHAPLLSLPDIRP